FDIGTNTHARTEAWAIVCSYNHTRCIPKRQGMDKVTNQYGKPLSAVYLRNARYRFHIAVTGNGLDTHRLWEVLYLGSVPIVMTSVLDKLYENLPVLIVQSWHQVGSITWLESEW